MYFSKCELYNIILHMKKNIAICLTGYFSNKDGDDLTKTNYIQENIINKLIQQWSLELRLMIHLLMDMAMS